MGLGRFLGTARTTKFPCKYVRVQSLAIPSFALNTNGRIRPKRGLIEPFRAIAEGGCSTFDFRLFDILREEGTLFRVLFPNLFRVAR